MQCTNFTEVCCLQVKNSRLIKPLECLKVCFHVKVLTHTRDFSFGSKTILKNQIYLQYQLWCHWRKKVNITTTYLQIPDPQKIVTKKYKLIKKELILNEDNKNWLKLYLANSIYVAYVKLLCSCHNFLFGERINYF